VTAKIFHPLLAMIASATNNELAKYVQYLKEENRILRARIPGQVHTKPAERERPFGSVDLNRLCKNPENQPFQRI